MRSYAHFEPYEYAIYLSIDEWRQLIQDPNNRTQAIEILIEELIHAYTTNLYDSERAIRVGFSRYSKGETQPLPLGVYRWSAKRTEKPSDSQKSIPNKSLKENPNDITLTENMTRLAVALCVLSEKDMLIFYREQQDGKILPLLIADKQTIRRAFDSGDIVERLIGVMASGKREKFKKLIVEQLTKSAPHVER